VEVGHTQTALGDLQGGYENYLSLMLRLCLWSDLLLVRSDKTKLTNEGRGVLDISLVKVGGSELYTVFGVWLTL
jgi:hypothetical protein